MLNKIIAQIENIRWNKFPPDIFIQMKIVVIILLLSLQSALSQSGYNTTYDIGVALRFLSVESTKDNIYISGFYRKSSSDYQSGFVASVDSLGQLQWWSEISDDSSSLSVSSESCFSLSGNNIIVFPFVYFNRPSFGVAILNAFGSIESIQEYPQDSGSVTSPRDILEIADGYLITGWTTKPPLYYTNGFVMKVNFDGKKQWMHEYGHPVYEENSRTISVVNSNYFVISGSQYQVDPLPAFDRSWAIAMDSTGKIIWDWYSDESEIPEKGIASMQYDTLTHEWVYFTFFERPTTYPGETYDVLVPVFVRRDSAMNLISYEEFGPYAIHHYMGVLEPSMDGGWVAAGRYTTTTDDYVSPLSTESGRIIKLSKEGTLEWSVIDTAFFHPELGSRSYLSGVTESPSGSIYAVGWANNYNENDVYRSYGWLLKITKDGCIDTLCTTSSLVQQIQDRESNVKVYPNPATDYLIVDYREQSFNRPSFELYDLVGHLILKDAVHEGVQSYGLDDAFSGMYLWRVIDAHQNELDSGKLLIK